MPTNSVFETAFNNLNPAQKKAVTVIEGPVMVVAGPGTGKTQVLSLRIAQILLQTDTLPSGILCLTFTNAGVRAMRERLMQLIGSRGSEVYISTFHRFAIKLIEEHYALLGFEIPPTLLSDTEAVALIDTILERGEWKHIRPRSDAARYFSDLKSLISLLKRENLSPTDFLNEVNIEIETIRTDPENISSRGARKGEIKKEILKQIEALERTREVVTFYEQYEAEKRERALMDYDDVLSYAVILAETSENVQATIRENYLYVLVDEHQDSNGVQNAFLEAVWGDAEQPNIFVVGDDRQLIYGFGGASLEQFTRFRNQFGSAQEITLTQNYRSTQIILDAADALLKSTLADGALKSNYPKAGNKITMLECGYPRDEIIAIAQDIKEKIKAGIAPEECAILVPKNYQVRSAVAILRDQGISVAASGTLSFFALPETQTVRNILRIIVDPFNTKALAESLLDPAYVVPPLEAHTFLHEVNTRKLSLEDLLYRGKNMLATDPIARVGTLFNDWLNASQAYGIQGLIQRIGEDLFFSAPHEHETFLRQVEIIRTFLHLVSAETEKNPHLSLAHFIEHLDRLESYGHEIPLAVFSGESGVQVLTLHGSKGLEFRCVYVAHLDDASFMKGKRSGFALPESIASRIETKDELVARRELYVAITRAKEYCTLSYARNSYSGAELIPARILSDIPEEMVTLKHLEEIEKDILKLDPRLYVTHDTVSKIQTSVADLAKIVATEYQKTNVSVTLLNNFFECPWKWYFRNLLKVPEGKSESLLLGSVVHAGIEYYIKHRGKHLPDNLEETLQQALTAELVVEVSAQNRVLREAHNILDKFSSTYLPRISPRALSERSVAYRDPLFQHLTCYGKIDLTERDSDTIVHVTDFKTGSAKPSRIIEKLDEEGRMSGLLRQLAMYSFLIRGAEKGTAVETSKLLFLEADIDSPDAVYMKQIGREEIELLKRDIQDYDMFVSGGEWVNRQCQAETYGKKEGCEYCAKAQRLYFDVRK